MALEGGPQYSRALNGNWDEERKYSEMQMKDFCQRKDSANGLKVNQAQAVLQKALAPVELSESEDGHIQFGMIIRVRHSTCGVLSCDDNEKVNKSDLCPAIAATAANDGLSCRRNAFKIERANENDGFEGDHLCYGQGFRLKCESGNFEGYLHSEFVSPQSASKLTRNQEVCFSQSHQGTVWEVQAANSKQLLEKDRDRVGLFEAIVLKHKATASFLASFEKETMQNLFGVEREICGKRGLSKNKVHQLTSERDGKVDGTQILRHIASDNHWTLEARTNQ